MYRKSLHILYLLLTYCTFGFSQVTVILPKENSGINLNITGNNFAIFTDTDQNANISTIIDNYDSSKFELFQGDFPNFGFDVGTYWMHIKIKNPTNRQKKLYLELRNPILDSVFVYQYDGIFIKEVCKTGDRLAFDNRPVYSRNFIIPIQISPHNLYDYYIKVVNLGEQCQIPIKLVSDDMLRKKNSKEQMMFGGYYGLLTFTLLFNLFMLLLIKERENLYYSFYILFLLALQFSLNGHAFMYFWPKSVYLANHANAIFASLSVMFLLLFVQKFLNTCDFVHPYFQKSLRAIAILLAANATIAIIPTWITFRISVLVVNGLTLILSLLIIYISITAIKKGVKAAQYFLFAFALLIISVFIFLMRNFGVISESIFTEYSLVFGSASEVILLSFAIINKFKSIRDENLKSLQEINEIKTQANILLEKQVAERTSELQQANNSLQLINEEILASIRYAKDIQRAVLPSEEKLNEVLGNSFLIYLPKDIVSGDFYWVANDEGANNIYVAVADCTGHGVPGALMSMLGTTLLNQIILETPDIGTDILLNKLRKSVIESLDKSGNAERKDGMDIALLRINKTTRTIQYSGAFNPLVLIRKSEIIEYKANRQPIGRHYVMADFTHETFTYEKGDRVYLYSDGITDQFNEQGSKIKKKGVFNWLLTTHEQPMHNQRDAVLNNFISWMAYEEQTDDVAMIGIELP